MCGMRGAQAQYHTRLLSRPLGSLELEYHFAKEAISRVALVIEALTQRAPGWRGG